jgi:acyl-homoserine lactone acylase PvdQ
MVLAKEWVPLMLKSISDAKLSERETKALSHLKNWDFVAHAEGVAPSVFHATVNEMVKNTFKKRLGEDLYQQYIKNNYMTFNTLRNLIGQDQSVWFDDPDTPAVEGIDEIIVTSFKDAVSYLEGQMGEKIDGWKWGKLLGGNGASFTP